MRDFTCDIFLEGEYNEELYELDAIKRALEEWVEDGYNPPEDSVLGLYDDDIVIKEVLVSGGAIWQ